MTVFKPPYKHRESAFSVNVLAKSSLQPWTQQGRLANSRTPRHWDAEPMTKVGCFSEVVDMSDKGIS